MSEPSTRRTSKAALLLTDVVDSTRLSEQLGDIALAELWAKHDRVARDLLPVHHGREIDKTDGFLMLFDSAASAVAYAVAYHRALRALGIAARAGLHVGEVILTENALEDVARGAKPLEVDGIAKPTAARVMSVAAGGQTLLTASAVEALGKTALRVESHGHWRMKGVAEPIELFEVGDDEAPFQPPPDAGKVYRVVRQGELWLPIRDVRHEIPAERDAFVGRTEDLQTLHGLLERSRLVSVLGIGGTGKTRLVARYGWTWLGDHPGGVWFCDLSEARGADGIVQAVVRTLGAQLSPGEPVAQVGRAIAQLGPCLVILDNFEQVAGFAAETLGPWLDRAPEARFVVTTREILGLPGEATFALAPLRQTESFDLFVARARMAMSGFEPTDRASIQALVSLLDGLPLAIELAASRVRIMAPKILLQRMSQRFQLLASPGGRSTRQATLRGALDWSWDLLAADEQAALAQLSVFEGGFTLEAAELVLALDELWPMDAVQALVDKSLVRQVAEERFDLLVSVQEYAAEKLEAVGGRLAAEARHVDWLRALDTAASGRPGTTYQQIRRKEMDNLRAGCERCLALGNGETAARLLNTLSGSLETVSPAAGVHLAERILALPDLSPLARARTDVVRSWGLRALGRVDEAIEHLVIALGICRDEGFRSGERDVLWKLGILYTETSQVDAALAHLEAATAIRTGDQDRHFEGVVLNSMGVICIDTGRFAEAIPHLQSALAAHREVGDRNSEGVVLGNLGSAAHGMGRIDEARDHYLASLAIDRELGNLRSEAIGLANLGSLLRELGQIDEARRNMEAAVDIARSLGFRRFEGHARRLLGSLQAQQSGYSDEVRQHFEFALVVARETRDLHAQGSAHGSLADMHRDLGRVDLALEHYEAALAVARQLGARLLEGQVLKSVGSMHVEQGRLDEARVCLRAGESLLREVGDPMALAPLLLARARLDAQQGLHDDADAALDETDAMLTRMGVGPEAGLARGLEEARRAVEASRPAR